VEWSKLHNFKIGIVNIGVIKSWTRGVGLWYDAYMGRRQFHTGLWSGNLKERDHLEYPSIDWKTKSFTLHTLPVTSSLIY
jgi:hypothetical protein